MNNNSHDYDEKYIKIKFSSDDDLPLKKTVKSHDSIIIVRSVLNDDKYYPQVLLDDCFCKLAGKVINFGV